MWGGREGGAIKHRGQASLDGEPPATTLAAAKIGPYLSQAETLESQGRRDGPNRAEGKGPTMVQKHYLD